VFCNPPYSKVTLHLWIAKALEASRKGTTVVLVLPQWNYPWYDLCEKHGRVHRVAGPVRFHRPDGSYLTLNSNSVTSTVVVVVFGSTVRPGNGFPIRRGEKAVANEPKFTSQDRKDLASYEKTIEQWLDKSVDAGKALLAIKERKLYLIGKHVTFEAYVRARYAKTRQWAYDEINRAVVLAQTGYDLPTSVAQPLKGLDAKTQKDVVSKASQIAKSQKRETPSRKDVEAAIAATPAAAKKKSPTLKMVREEHQPVHRLSFSTTHRDDLLQIVREFGEDVKVTVGNDKEPVVVECNTLASLGLHVFKLFEKLPAGSRYELSLQGEIVAPKPEQASGENKKSA
jgi:hypothetical protein